MIRAFFIVVVCVAALSAGATPAAAAIAPPIDFQAFAVHGSSAFGWRHGLTTFERFNLRTGTSSILGTQPSQATYTVSSKYGLAGTTGDENGLTSLVTSRTGEDQRVLATTPSECPAPRILELTDRGQLTVFIHRGSAPGVVCEKSGIFRFSESGQRRKIRLPQRISRLLGRNPFEFSRNLIAISRSSRPSQRHRSLWFYDVAKRRTVRVYRAPEYTGDISALLSPDGSALVIRNRSVRRDSYEPWSEVLYMRSVKSRPRLLSRMRGDGEATRCGNLAAHWHTHGNLGNDPQEIRIVDLRGKRLLRQPTRNRWQFYGVACNSRFLVAHTGAGGYYEPQPNEFANDVVDLRRLR